MWRIVLRSSRRKTVQNQSCCGVAATGVGGHRLTRSGAPTSPTRRVVRARSTSAAPNALLQV
jgi:hypothetical protein